MLFLYFRNPSQPDALAEISHQITPNPTEVLRTWKTATLAKPETHFPALIAGYTACYRNGAST
jgi:hypothetical protein